MTTRCPMKLTYFPFDTQDCAIHLGPWAYTVFQVNATPLASKPDLDYFQNNAEWDLIKMKTSQNITYYSGPRVGMTVPFATVGFHFSIRRKPKFYLINFLVPFIVISTVALLGFFLPLDSGEKITLDVSVLLSMSVFLMVFLQTLPASSDNFPLLSKSSI